MSCSASRWKGKGFAAIARENPLSEIVERLKASLLECKPLALLSGCGVIFEVKPELADLLQRSCFGQPLTTYEKDKQWFQLGPEEAFYLEHALKCLLISAADGRSLDELQVWTHLTVNEAHFPYHYKAYAHLRAKNWVVRPGLQYGATFVAYRHHPALVHSEYAVLVCAENDQETTSHRLKDWTDWQCALRVSGGVAKILLVLSVNRNNSARTSLSCLEEYTVEEHTITRWVLESTRESNSSQADAFSKKCSSVGSLD